MFQQATNWWYFSFFFRRKQDLTLHAKCLLRRQFTWNGMSCFWVKIRKNISKCRLLKFLSTVLSVKALFTRWLLCCNSSLCVRLWFMCYLICHYLFLITPSFHVLGEEGCFVIGAFPGSRSSHILATGIPILFHLSEKLMFVIDRQTCHVRY